MHKEKDATKLNVKKLMIEAICAMILQKELHIRKETQNGLRITRHENEINRGEEGSYKCETEQANLEGSQDRNLTGVVKKEEPLGHEEIRKEVQEQISFLGQNLRNTIENTINSVVQQQQQQQQQYVQRNHYQQVYPQPWNIGVMAQ